MSNDLEPEELDPQDDGNDILRTNDEFALLPEGEECHCTPNPNTGEEFICSYCRENYGDDPAVSLVHKRQHERDLKGAQ